MKIALVCFGHTDVVLPLYKNLKQNRVDVDLIFCFALNRKSESVLNFEDMEIATGFLSVKKIEEVLSKEMKTYLGDISSVKLFIYHNLKLRSFRNFLLSFKLVNKLKKYDVIHFNGTNGVLPILISLLRKKKLIFTIHDIHSHSGERTRFNFAEKLNEYVIKSKYPLIVQNLPDYEYLTQQSCEVPYKGGIRALDNKFKICYKKLTNFRICYKALKKKDSSIAEKIKFIPFGVLDIYREFKEIENKNSISDILLFGRISPYKGIEYLITAIEKMKERGILLKTIIAGNGEVYFNTSKFAELGIMLINRYIPNAELVSLISGTKIVICPYTDATQSGVVMTAFAFNKPVIASDVGGFPEVIKDGITGFLVPPKDSDALASKIALLISDSNLLKKMSENIQKKYSSGEYSWQHIAMKIGELYTFTIK
jgi:glycosyltransferase involved in cell wall biosynthesis